MNNIILLSIARLANNLKRIGLEKDAGDMVNLLNDLLDTSVEQPDDDAQKDGKYSKDQAVSIMGLREDGTYDNMNQGFSVEPFFSGSGDLG